MKHNIATKWASALRCGKYKQGKNALKTKSKKGIIKHCCLGVLCELYNKEHKKKLKTTQSNGHEISRSISGRNNISKVFSFEDSWDSLPVKVLKWAGINNTTGCLRNGSFSNKFDKWFSLSDMNDDGINFKKISDFIEESCDNL